MKKKVLFTILALASVLATATVYAQGWGRDGDEGYRGGRGRGCGNGFGYGYGRGGFARLDAMKEDLGLTDQQVKQIFDLGTKFREKAFENRKDINKLDELRIEHRKAIEGVLTKDQLEKFNKIRNERYGRFGGCPGRW
jgi:Spy/CpxP family protein refolding chaperone